MLLCLSSVKFTFPKEFSMRLIPRKLFLTRGVGVHREKLSSFEMALREAGIAHFNLVRVSSIFPPNCTIVDREEGLKLLQPGEIVFAVIAEMSSNEPGRRIASSIGVARPTDRDKYGYLSEHHAYGQTEQEAGDYAEDLAATMLATTLNIPFDADKDYNERKEQYMIGREIVDSTSITVAVNAEAGGIWTTVVAAAILI
jgi:arginine decarboxylase